MNEKKTEHQYFEKYARQDGRMGVRKDEQTGGHVDGHGKTTERCKDAFAPFSRKNFLFGPAWKISLNTILHRCMRVSFSVFLSINPYVHQV